MGKMIVDIADIARLEGLLLPRDCHFATDAQTVINWWDSANVLACPGSGKTTVLLAKLKLLADVMPFADGSGICILSHTNVAVDEIKRRLNADSEKILGYPNFAGTIHSFLDRFIVYPFFRPRLTVPLRIVARDEYARRAWKIIQNNGEFSSLRYAILHRYGEKMLYKTANAVFEKLSLENGALLLAGKQIARADCPSAKQFLTLTSYLLKKDGLMTYERSLGYAHKILERHGEIVRPLLARRFRRVFIDEYQDCSSAQRCVLDALFAETDTVVMRIGDLDQAIYDNPEEVDDQPLEFTGTTLEIAESSRYGDEIASVLTKLRAGQHLVKSRAGLRSTKPTLFVYAEGAEKKIVDAFVKEIWDAGLPNGGVYKAIGMIRRGNARTILNYWNSFDNDTAIPLSRNGWEFYRQEIIRQLLAGRVYRVEKCVIDLLVLVARCCAVRTEEGKFYNATFVRQKITERAREEFGNLIIGLSEKFAKDKGDCQKQLTEILATLCASLFEHVLTEEEVSKCVADDGGKGYVPVALDQKYDGGISVELNTVHGVKGETHDATLYLETEHYGKSDLERILPLLEGKPFQYHGRAEKARRCVYVGWSRPRHLLCVAMKAKTYEGHESCFESDWKVVKIQ